MELYGGGFLNHRPYREELDMLEEKYVRKGFPGWGDCIDCMKIVLKNCPAEENVNSIIQRTARWPRLLWRGSVTRTFMYGSGSSAEPSRIMI